MDRPWEENYRLPSDVNPDHYDLYLNPNLETNRFSGRVSILLKVTSPRNHLLAHIKYMNVTKSEVRDSKGNSVSVAQAFEYSENEFWVVQLSQDISAGDYTLSLEFSGPLDNGILGFYKSVYTDEKGMQHSIATSKFQPTYARRAFPCFDEPTFKSTFTITVVRPSGNNYTALSNMEIKNQTADSPAQGLTEVTFGKSQPMVTYLAVFIVCDFVYIETSKGATPKHNITFKVYGTSLQKDKLEYALKVGENITDFYIDYFKVPYPLPKLDMAAIPDYSSGATEHWGMITYRETNLIFDPNESSSLNQQRVASVIAHELVHQWFGNLVTLEWWNDLWLNEGFATFLSYKGVKNCETDWDTDSWFLYDDLHPVLDLDATLSSHSIVVDVNTPDQINAVFDTISYSKGSSVIRMMESFMGEIEFEEGITNFLTKFSFQNAVTQNLFDELTAVSTANLDITKIMNTWTKQKGYPILNLTRNGSNFTIKQERFLTDPEAYEKETEASDYKYRWEIPVTYISSESSSKIQKWFPFEDEEITVEIPANAQWVKFNVDQLGYYRVNYPLEDWNTLSSLLVNDMTKLSVSDRTSLLNDAFSIAAAGDRLPYEIALNMTKYLVKEDQWVPWSTLNSQLSYFSDVFYYDEVYPNLINYTRALTDDLYNILGWEDEGDFNRKMLRTKIIGLACESGNTDCLKTAGEKFTEWKENGTKVAPNLRSLVYGYGMATIGNQETWDWMLAKYVQESNAQEKTKLMYGLASIKNPWILYRFIQLAKNVEIVRQQDYFTLMTYVSRNRVGEPIVWDFVRNEWDYLVNRFTLNDRSFGRMISTITARFSTERRLQEMKDFFEENPEAGAGEQYRSIALEQVENNIKFCAKYKSDINSWLLENIST